MKKIGLAVLLVSLAAALSSCGGGGGGGGTGTAALAAPTGVNAVAVSTSLVSVTWTPVAGATGYNVYTSSTPTVDLVPGNRLNGSLITSATYSDISVLANSAYNYRVTAVGAGGESAGSNLASAATGSWNVQQAPGMNVTLGLKSAAWSGTEFVAVGDAGSVYTSPTGSTWTSETSGTWNSMHRVRWVNGQYVAAGDNTSIYTSLSGTSGGTSWTERHTSSDNVPYYGIAWSGSTYLATGLSNTNDQGAQATSSNGTSWLASFATPTTGPLYDAVWSNPSGTTAKFVAVGPGAVGPDFWYGTVYSSADGSTWALQKIANYRGNPERDRLVRLALCRRWRLRRYLYVS